MDQDIKFCRDKNQPNTEEEEEGEKRGDKEERRVREGEAAPPLMMTSLPDLKG